MGSPPAGKTRTKDKYRVVYSDHQRLELEKEFHYSRYITIRRKSELATMLVLSERQVKIWFQNRRAKERKQLKKREDIGQKDKMDAVVAAAGVAFHHPPSLHQLTHHPQAPPHHPHLGPIHPHPHPQPQPQPHAHEYHHLNPHCLTPKPSPLMLPDVKPNLSMD
ncbi:UNVERIFIED_CONTAM: hypothetical protein GTU68_023849 [Idotea baltica]|nr:hypothetical protein [Idotea baltica]